MEKLLQNFNNNCANCDNCDSCDYNCSESGSLVDCALFYGYGAKATEIINLIDDVDMDSNTIYIKINKDKIDMPHIKNKKELKYFIINMIADIDSSNYINN